jgi:methanogenic corrinoid protein MtbC1
MGCDPMAPPDASVSPKAVASFRANFPRLQALVNESFAKDDRLCAADPSGCDRAFLADSQKFWGETFLATCEFGLLESLGREFRWLAGLLDSHGFRNEVAAKGLEAWIMGIHGILPPSDARELVAPLLALKGSAAAATGAPPDPGPALSGPPRDLLNLFLRKDRRRAAEFASAFLDRRGVEGFLDTWEDLLVPALREIGRLWQTNRASAADEHAATEICRYILYRLSDSLAQEESTGGSVLIACVEGEEHSLPAEALAEVFRLRGWEVRLTGRSAPTADVIAMVLREKPGVVVLSARLVRSLPGARALLETLRRRVPGIRMIAGGEAAAAAASILGQWADAVAVDIREGYDRAAGRGGYRA